MFGCVLWFGLCVSDFVNIPSESDAVYNCDHFYIQSSFHPPLMDSSDDSVFDRVSRADLLECKSPWSALLSRFQDVFSCYFYYSIYNPHYNCNFYVGSMLRQRRKRCLNIDSTQGHVILFFAGKLILNDNCFIIYQYSCHTVKYKCKYHDS